RGHDVTLISGSVSLGPPDGVRLISVTTAQEMYEAVRDRLAAGDIDAAVFAAAVADYRPVAVSTHKIKKSAGRLTLELEPAPDILGSARDAMGFRGVLCGFAAETDDLLANARAKLVRKGCDLIAANDVSREGTGFDADENEVTLVFADGEVRELPRASKREIAEILVGICADLVARSGHDRSRC